MRADARRGREVVEGDSGVGLPKPGGMVRATSLPSLSDAKQCGAGPRHMIQREASVARGGAEFFSGQQRMVNFSITLFSGSLLFLLYAGIGLLDVFGEKVVAHGLDEPDLRHQSGKMLLDFFMSLVLAALIVAKQDTIKRFGRNVIQKCCGKRSVAARQAPMARRFSRADEIVRIFDERVAALERDEQVVAVHLRANRGQTMPGDDRIIQRATRDSVVATLNNKVMDGCIALFADYFGRYFVTEFLPRLGGDSNEDGNIDWNLKDIGLVALTYAVLMMTLHLGANFSKRPSQWVGNIAGHFSRWKFLCLEARTKRNEVEATGAVELVGMRKTPEVSVERGDEKEVGLLSEAKEGVSGSLTSLNMV